MLISLPPVWAPGQVSSHLVDTRLSWPPLPPSPQGGLRRNGRQHSFNPAYSPTSPLLFVVATGLGAQGRMSCRCASLWAWGATDQEAPEVAQDCSRGWPPGSLLASAWWEGGKESRVRGRHAQGSRSGWRQRITQAVWEGGNVPRTTGDFITTCGGLWV